MMAFPSVTGGPSRIEWGEAVAEPSRLDVRDVRGRVVREIAVPTGSRTVFWDGHTSAGKLVDPGVYYLRLEGAGATEVTRLVVER